MLVILATISINTIFNGGLIDKAELAKQKALLADYEERIKIIAVDEKTGKMMDASIKDKLIDLVKVRLENEDWVGTVEKVDEEPKQLKVITTDKYIIVVEIDEDGTVKIIEEGPDDGEPYPSLKLTQEPYNEDDGATIRIKVEAEVEKTTKTKKVTTVRIVKPESMKEEKEYAEGGVIFEVTENGVYTFEAETNMGKTKRKTIEINISKPESDIEITSKPTTPRNTKETGTQNGIAKGPINVEIKYGDNSYIKQYRKETDESWTEVNGTTASFTVTENIAIFAKYSDGTNSFKTVTYNIQNVDNVVPNAFSVTETHTTNSITVGASTTDTASTGASSTIAGILRYEYRIYKNSAWQGWQGSNTFTGLTTGTYKVQAKAIDKAGNETISSESANITLGTVSTADIKVSSSPTTPRNTGTAGTQNGVAKGPITVNITYGNSSYTRQYKIGTSGSWTNVTGTTASFTVTENVAIFARYFDGTNGFQTQAYNIQNVDNVAPNAFSVTETHTTNSITVGASTTDTASEGASSTIAGILRYEYRIYKNSAWQGWQTANTFTGLTTGTYKVQAKAIDKAGNETVSSESANITLNSVSTADIKVSSSPTTPRNTGTAGTQNGVVKGPITVSITYGNSSYTRQYKIGTSGSWINVTGTTANFTVTENVAIFARYFDGTNGFQTQGYNIQNVDNVVPKISSYNATVSKNVITATCTATDTASTGASSTTAGILRYEYSNGGTTYQTSNTFKVSKAGTYTIYMKAIDKAGNQTIVNKQVTVSSYTVTYNANGGSGAPAGQTAISGINLTLSSTVPTRSGYTFLGWSTSSTATTATYAKGATYTANKSVTLYAVWKNNVIGVEWVDVSSPTIAGWSINCDAGTMKVKYTSMTFKVSGAGYKFTITGDDMDSSGVADIILYNESGNVIKSIGKNKDNTKSMVNEYIETTSETSKVYISSGGINVKVTKSDGTACKITDSRPVYTLEYYMNDGTNNLYTTMQVKKGNSYGWPTSPTRTGYRCIGWATDQNASSGTYPSSFLTSDITYYAVWKNLYTINYYKNDGTTTKYATQTGINGESLNVPTAPTKSGYPFLGWSTDKNARSGYTDKITVAGNANYYAIWQEPTLTIRKNVTTVTGGTYEAKTGTIKSSAAGFVIFPPKAGYIIQVISANDTGGVYAEDSNGNTLWSCTNMSGTTTYTTTGDTYKIRTGGSITIKIMLKDGSACKLVDGN